MILDVLSRFLKAEGRVLVLAGSAAEALEKAAGRDVDVAIIDKNLGDGSGLEVARALRRQRPDLEVILITGYASFDSAIEAVRIGAFDYVTKPVSDYEGLSLKVHNAVEKVRMKREQRALLLRLSESEERYRGVFEASSDAILLFEEVGGRIADANPAAERLYGRSRGELLEMRLADLFDAPGPPPDLSAGGAAPRNLPARHLRAGGDPVPVELTVSDAPLHGRGLRVVSVRDVSERERAERQRRALEENLRHAQKMEAIGRLAGGVAHDFSNILAVILGYSDLLASELPADPRLHESLAGIAEAANRAVGVTRQLLTVSRKKLVRPEVLSLNEVVGSVGSLLSRAVGERIQLAVRPGENLWRVHADADQLAQVLLNLVVNARDAMPEGGLVSIETANLTVQTPPPGSGLAPGRYLALSVRDQGCGITEEVRARIFEPFFTTKESGTGLGLATVYGIVRQAGGEIQVDSTPGKGATFTVYLPAAPDEVLVSAARAPQRAAAGLGETVVLAEDEDALRRVLERTLSGRGYQVIPGRDGRDALEAARGHRGPIHLLVADVVMPRMSGTQLAEKLAADQPGLKVLFMTGHTDDPAIRGRILDGGLDIIQKPFTSEALLGHVRRLLDGPAPGAGAAVSS